MGSNTINQNVPKLGFKIEPGGSGINPILKLSKTGEYNWNNSIK